MVCEGGVGPRFIGVAGFARWAGVAVSAAATLKRAALPPRGGGLSPTLGQSETPSLSLVSSDSILLPPPNSLLPSTDQGGSEDTFSALSSGAFCSLQNSLLTSPAGGSEEALLANKLIGKQTYRALLQLSLQPIKET